jgi:class 3 adenylate cyclase
VALTNEQRGKVSDAITAGLARAESAWLKVGDKFLKKAMAMDAFFAEAHVEPSKIPGYPWVTDETPKVDEFVALVVDMRDSTKRLKTNLSAPVIKNGFQRIYYETSALLPAISVVTSFENGVVTEYLGDGALVLFQVDKERKEETIKAASRAARNCVDEMRELINKQLDEKYKLPNISLGAGLSISNALITLVGAFDNMQPKAIGECVWEASKLSGGTNVVHVSEQLWQLWPTSKGGKMQFHKTAVRGVPGYRLHQG